jgi:hypothetical protein
MTAATAGPTGVPDVDDYWDDWGQDEPLAPGDVQTGFTDGCWRINDARGALVTWSHAATHEPGPHTPCWRREQPAPTDPADFPRVVAMLARLRLDSARHIGEPFAEPHPEKLYFLGLTTRLICLTLELGDGWNAAVTASADRIALLAGL